MTLIKYENHRFQKKALATIAQANSVIAEYAEAGYSLTLRQLFYQMVVTGDVVNTKKEYVRLGRLISNARLAGLISWDAIVDRTRTLRGLATWNNVGHRLRDARRTYRRDLWKTQPFRPEVWIEKDALSDVFAQACNRNQVDFFSCRGYNSQSEMHAAGRWFRRALREDDQEHVILHFGDHDPSGCDMTRDIKERMTLFAGYQVKVIRMALNMDQVEKLDVPPNDAKLSDSRSYEYTSEFGYSSWELDALRPTYLNELTQQGIDSLRDSDLWDIEVRKQDADDETFEHLQDTYDIESA